MKIRTKLFGIVVLPLAVLVLFAGVHVRAKLASSRPTLAA